MLTTINLPVIRAVQGSRLRIFRTLCQEGSHAGSVSHELMPLRFGITPCHFRSSQNFETKYVKGLCVILYQHINVFLAATKNTYFRLSVRPSVRPSVCLSVRLFVRPSVRPSVTPFWQCSSHRIILKFLGVITIDRRDAHAKGQGQRLKVKVTEVMTPFSRFRTVTPV